MIDLSRILPSHAAWLRGELAGARANLAGADLAGANLARENLWGACLEGANLAGANLEGANLAGANLTGANLAGADLWGANLEGTCLAGADLWGANLEGTCLDPAAVPPAITDAEILAAGLEIEGEWILGWRTATSQHVGTTMYLPGSRHEAPVLSVSRETACHPGIYLASREWLSRQYPSEPVVRCRARRGETVHAGDKWRTRRLEIASEDGTWRD